MCLRLLGRFKRFAAVGGSEGVLRGSGEWLEEDPRGRFCMLNRRNYTRNGHDWNTMPADMELESLSGGGGVRIFGRGVREKGVRTNPPNLPPWLGPAANVDAVTPLIYINYWTDHWDAEMVKFRACCERPLHSSF